MSTPTARADTHVAERAWDLPHLVTSLSEGEITFDKLRAVSDVATPETDPEVRDRARECSVRQLAELARRSVTAQLPAESYAEVRPSLEGRARKIPSDGETPWDHRLCDALLESVRSASASPYFVVTHVPLAALIDESGEASGGRHSNRTRERPRHDSRTTLRVW